MRAGFGVTLKLLYYELGVMGSKYRNILSSCRGKAAYIYLSLNLVVASAMCIEPPFLIKTLMLKYSYKQEILDLAAVKELVYLFRYGINLV